MSYAIMRNNNFETDNLVVYYRLNIHLISIDTYEYFASKISKIYITLFKITIESS